MATSNISELQKGVTSVVCTQDSESVTCIPSKDVSLEVLVRDISLPNTVFKTNGVIPLKKGIPHTQKLSDIVTSYRPSSYVITFQVKDQSNVPSGKYSFGYIKEGDMSRILSLVPQVLVENENITLKAVIYTNTVSDTKKPYDFKITLNDTCGSMVTPATSNVSVVTIATKCSSGNMEVSLVSNGKVLDTLQATYSLPADKIVNTSGNKNSSSVALGNNKTTIQVTVLVIVTIIVLGLVLIIFYKKKRLPVVPVSIIFIFFFLTSFSQAHAALYVVGGTVTYEYCQKGNPVVPTWSCTDVMGEPWPVLSQSGYTTSGTVTVPSSVTPGSSYTVTITQSLTSTLRTTCGFSSLPCTSADIQTIVIKDLPGTAYNSLPCGYAGSLCSTPFDIYFDRALGPSSFTLTASSSGTIKLGILQSASGNGVTSCTNNCFTYPYTYNLITIPITAPCTWGWGVGTYLNPGGNKSDPGCDVGMVDPATVCNSSNGGQVLICFDVPPDAFRYVCACRVGTPAPTVNLWFSP